jgi:hypothetical protein
MPRLRRATRTARLLLTIAAVLCTSTASADVITIDWDVVPADIVDPNGFPYYECDGPGSRSLVKCDYHWDQGLELLSPEVRLYGDKWFDGFEAGAVPESALASDAGNAMRIQPSCRPGFAPCLDAFVPLQLILGVHVLDFPGNVFVASSAGDILKLPSLADQTYAIAFPLSMQEPIAWLRVGFYHPAACEDGDPSNDADLDCGPAERALTVEQFTFAVPEPGVALLVGVVGSVAALRARRRRLRR